MRRRKQLIPAISLTALCWGGLGYLIYRISPHSILSIGPFLLSPLLLFFLILFLALFFSFSLLFNNTRRGFLIAIGITALVLLRLFKLFHPLYTVFIAGLLGTVEFYFLKK